MTKIMEAFRIGEVIRLGWEKFKKHFFYLWILLGIMTATGIFFELLDKNVENDLFKLMASLVSVVLSITMQLGLYRIYLDLIDSDTEGGVKKLFSQFRLFWRYFGACLLVGLMVLLGLILLVVPGIYFALKYQFFSYLIVDKNLGIMDALRKSAEMTEGIKWQLFFFSLTIIGLNILGAFVFLLGLLVSIPVSTLAYTYVYRSLTKRLEQSVETEVNPVTPSVPVVQEVEIK